MPKRRLVDENGDPICIHGCPMPGHPDYDPQDACRPCVIEEERWDYADKWYDESRNT